MKYVTFNPDGTLGQRLIEGIHPIPTDAVEVDDLLWRRVITETDGVWSRDSAGSIVKSPFPTVPLTNADIERMRLLAYSDPVKGSDRQFAESNRMQMMGEPGWEPVRQAAIDRFNEIQALYPWPAQSA